MTKISSYKMTLKNIFFPTKMMLKPEGKLHGFNLPNAASIHDFKESLLILSAYLMDS